MSRKKERKKERKQERKQERKKEKFASPAHNNISGQQIYF